MVLLEGAKAVIDPDDVRLILVGDDNIRIAVTVDVADRHIAAIGVPVEASWEINIHPPAITIAEPDIVGLIVIGEIYIQMAIVVEICQCNVVAVSRRESQLIREDAGPLVDPQPTGLIVIGDEGIEIAIPVDISK